VISGISILKSTSGYIFISNFLLSVGEGPPTVASGSPSAAFPTLAETSSYANGLQLNFPE